MRTLRCKNITRILGNVLHVLILQVREEINSVLGFAFWPNNCVIVLHRFPSSNPSLIQTAILSMVDKTVSNRIILIGIH